MKRKLRQRQIIDLLSTELELSISDVCSKLRTSEATVRREFVQIVKDGRALRTWGGIRRLENAGPSIAPPAFASRLDRNISEKKAIAAAAAALLEDGDVVMVDGGTTTLQLCPLIALKRVRVITNSLVIAHEVDRLKGNTRGAEIYLTGGILQPESGVVAGPAAEAFLKRYHAKWAFLSAAGVDESAVTNYNESVLGSEQRMLAQSARIALLVDQSKLGRRAMSVLCPVSMLDVLITGDGKQHQELLEQISRSGVHVQQVTATSVASS